MQSLPVTNDFTQILLDARDMVKSSDGNNESGPGRHENAWHNDSNVVADSTWAWTIIPGCLSRHTLDWKTDDGIVQDSETNEEEVTPDSRGRSTGTAWNEIGNAELGLVASRKQMVVDCHTMVCSSAYGAGTMQVMVWISMQDIREDSAKSADQNIPSRVIVRISG